MWWETVGWLRPTGSVRSQMHASPPGAAAMSERSLTRSAVAEWGHVRLFSGWPELVDGAASRLLVSRGWEAPTSGYPTGAEWIERYLAPLAEALEDHVRYDSRLTGVSRKGGDRLVDAGRETQPFTFHVRDAVGNERRVEARAGIDASGAWHPQPRRRRRPARPR